MPGGTLGGGALAAIAVLVVGAVALRGRMRFAVTGAGLFAALLLAALAGMNAIQSPELESGASAAPKSMPAGDVARAVALLSTAAIAHDQGRASDTRRALGEADALFQRAGDVRGRATVALHRANLEAALGEPDAARTAYAGARDLYKRSGDPAGEAMTWAAMGDLDRAAKRLESARTAYREARAANDRANGEVNGQHGLLGFEVEADAPDGIEHARQRLGEAYALYEEIADPVGMAQASTALAQLEQGLGNYGGAFAGYSDAVSQYRRVADAIGFAEASTRLGLLESQNGYADAARVALTDAIVTFAERGDADRLAIALLVLGRVERQVGNYQSSRDTFLNAKDIAVAKADVLIRGESELGIGEAGRLLGHTAGSRAAYEAAIGAFARADPASAGPATLGLARALHALGDRDGARAAFAAAAGIFRAVGDDRGEALTHIERGFARLAIGEAAGALEDFRNAFDPLLRWDSPIAGAAAQAGTAAAKLALGDREGAGYGGEYVRAELRAAQDRLRGANELLDLGAFGALQFHESGDGAAVFARQFPRANAEALAFLARIDAALPPPPQ